MRKVLLSIAAAGTVLAFATPASAQWAPRPGYGYGNGYNQNMGHWQNEIQQLRFQMDELGRSGRLTGREARDLRNDIRATERQLYRSGRNGITPWEARSIDQRIQRVRYELRRYSDYDHRGGWRRY